jgi:uncharacterized SAM-binding protein YcdF (DUF218 family)
MFLLGKIGWVVLAPGNFLALMLAAGVLWLLVSRRQRGLSLVAASALGFLAILLLPVGDWLILPLESRFPVPATLPGRVDGIVVLGGAVDTMVSAARGRVELNNAGTRMVEAAALARRYPSARVVLTGGDNNVVGSSALSEADVMKAFFVAEGVDPARIILESKSRTTFENAVFTYALVQPKAGETWILVTSAEHMPRSVGCFRRQGWTVLPYPVDFQTAGNGSFHWELSLAVHLALANMAMREWVGLVGYRLAGRTDALFPAPS